MEIPFSVNQILTFSPSVGHKIKRGFFYCLHCLEYSQALQGLLTRSLDRGMLCVMMCLTPKSAVFS